MLYSFTGIDDGLFITTTSSFISIISIGCAVTGGSCLLKHKIISIYRIAFSMGYRNSNRYSCVPGLYYLEVILISFQYY